MPKEYVNQEQHQKNKAEFVSLTVLMMEQKLDATGSPFFLLKSHRTLYIQSWNPDEFMKLSLKALECSESVVIIIIIKL